MWIVARKINANATHFVMLFYIYIISKAVLRIRIHMFLDLPDPDPSIIMQKL